MGASGREGASRWFCGVEAALVEEVAKRRLARKRRLAAERWLVARAGADDGEPKLAVKRLLMAAQFLLAALRRRRLFPFFFFFFLFFLVGRVNYSMFR